MKNTRTEYLKEEKPSNKHDPVSQYHARHMKLFYLYLYEHHLNALVHLSHKV